jgi:hypothetical protein
MFFTSEQAYNAEIECYLLVSTTAFKGHKHHIFMS